MANTIKTQSTIERIMRVSNEIRISKDGKNSFQNYEYFKPDDINKAIVPVLLEHGLYAKFDMIFNAEKGVYQGSLRIGNFENKDDFEIYSLDVKEALVKGASPVQCSGATMTYLKRYILMNAFNLADNKDDPDSHASVNNAKEVKPETKPETKITAETETVEEKLAKCKTEKELMDLYNTLKGTDVQTYREKFTKRKNQIAKLELAGGNGNGKQ